MTNQHRIGISHPINGDGLTAAVNRGIIEFRRLYPLLTPEEVHFLPDEMPTNVTKVAGLRVVQLEGEALEIFQNKPKFLRICTAKPLATAAG